MESEEKTTLSEFREEIATLYRHMDNLVHTRVNALLLSEEVLFAVSSAPIKPAWLRFAIALLGLAITIIWWIAIQVVHKKLGWLSEQYQQSSDLFKEFHAVGRPRGYPPLINDRTGLLLCQILPAVFFLFWIAMLFATASRG